MWLCWSIVSRVVFVFRFLLCSMVWCCGCLLEIFMWWILVVFLMWFVIGMVLVLVLMMSSVVCCGGFLIGLYLVDMCWLRFICWVIGNSMLVLCGKFWSMFRFMVMMWMVFVWLIFMLLWMVMFVFRVCVVMFLLICVCCWKVLDWFLLLCVWVDVMILMWVCGICRWFWLSVWCGW